MVKCKGSYITSKSCYVRITTKLNQTDCTTKLVLTKHEGGDLAVYQVAIPLPQSDEDELGLRCLVESRILQAICGGFNHSIQECESSLLFVFEEAKSECMHAPTYVTAREWLERILRASA